jgi:Peptidase family M41
MLYNQNQSLKIILVGAFSLSIANSMYSRDQSVSYLSNLSNNLSSVSSSFFGKTNPNLQQQIEQQAFKSQEILNFDGSKIIDYFNAHHKNIARIEINAKNIPSCITEFHDDGTQTRISYHPDRSQTIENFGTDRKSRSRQTINNQAITTSTVHFNHDGTQTRITYNPDKTQTVEIFGTDHKSSSRTQIDTQGQPIWSVKFNRNQTQEKTTYNPDGTQTTLVINDQGKIIATTLTQPHGIFITASAKLLVAWHEAGHALSYIHNHSLSLIDYITIKPDAATNTEGHVRSIQTYQADLSITDLENRVISALCGGAAEQVLLNEKMLNNTADIIKFFSNGKFASDIALARKDAQEIVEKQNFGYFNFQQIDQKIDAIIAHLYQQAYQFIVQHKHQVSIIAETLLKQETLSTDETYDLLNVDRPLLAHEQGPLPASLAHDYKYRGWAL